MKDSPAKPLGRPSSYSQLLADTICERIACGESVRTICNDPEMPATGTVYVWLGKHPDFQDQYARARDQQVAALAEEILDIADDGSNDWMENNKPNCPGYMENGEAMARSRLRVDTRKWLLSKLAPKKYGEKLDLNHTGTVDLSDAALEARIAALSAVVFASVDDVGESGQKASDAS